MSALVERIIAARDELKSLMGRASADDYTTLGMAREVMAAAANHIVGLEQSVKIAEEKSQEERFRHRASFGMDE